MKQTNQLTLLDFIDFIEEKEKQAIQEESKLSEQNLIDETNKAFAEAYEEDNQRTKPNVSGVQERLEHTFDLAVQHTDFGAMIKVVEIALDANITLRNLRLPDAN